MVLALIGVSMPIFWLALMLVSLFAVQLGWLPVFGMATLKDGFVEMVRHMILPGFCLATVPMATFARTTRSSMIEVLSSDSIRCLRARGIKESRVIMVHALKNALPPIVTVFGLQLAGTFAGAIITEGIFSWPGMGTMINTAINNRDYSLIQGAVLFIAIAFVFCNLLVDIAYMLLNPKVKA
jgi:peptide/nickel transport system permease protein